MTTFGDFFPDERSHGKFKGLYSENTLAKAMQAANISTYGYYDAAIVGGGIPPLWIYFTGTTPPGKKCTFVELHYHGRWVKNVGNPNDYGCGQLNSAAPAGLNFVSTFTASMGEQTTAGYTLAADESLEDVINDIEFTFHGSSGSCTPSGTGPAGIYDGEYRIFQMYVRAYFEDAPPPPALPDFVAPTTDVEIISPVGVVHNPQPSILVNVSQFNQLPIATLRSYIVQESIYNSEQWSFDFEHITNEPLMQSIAFRHYGVAGYIPVNSEEPHWLPLGGSFITTIPFVAKPSGVNGIYANADGLPPGKYRVYVATEISALAVVGTNYLQGLTFHQNYAEFEVVEATLPDAAGILSCGELTVRIKDILTSGQVGLPWSDISFTQVLDDTGNATVAIAGGDCSQELRQLFSLVEGWRYELRILMENELVFAGPIVSLSPTAETGGVTITARDKSAWADHRWLAYDRHFDFAYPASIFFALWEDALVVDASPAIQLMSFGGDGSVSTQVRESDHKLAGGPLRDLARSTVDFVAAGDRIYLAAGPLPFGELPPLIDDVNANVQLTRSGIDRASDVAAIGAGGGPQSNAIVAVSSTSEYPVLQTTVSASAVTSVETLRGLASSTLELVKNDRRTVSVAVWPGYQVPLRRILAGSLVRVKAETVIGDIDEVGLIAKTEFRAATDGTWQLVLGVNV